MQVKTQRKSPERTKRRKLTGNKTNNAELSIKPAVFGEFSRANLNLLAEMVLGYIILETVPLRCNMSFAISFLYCLQLDRPGFQGQNFDRRTPCLTLDLARHFLHSLHRHPVLDVFLE